MRFHGCSSKQTPLSRVDIDRREETGTGSKRKSLPAESKNLQNTIFTDLALPESRVCIEQALTVIRNKWVHRFKDQMIFRQWLWLSWQRGRLRYERSVVRIQSSANFIMIIFKDASCNNLRLQSKYKIGGSIDSCLKLCLSQTGQICFSTTPAVLGLESHELLILFHELADRCCQIYFSFRSLDSGNSPILTTVCLICFIGKRKKEFAKPFQISRIGKERC